LENKQMMNGQMWKDEVATDYRSGFVVVVGRPNVGKSTLVNACLGQKIAIVSEKPQTTRNRLLGIYTTDEAQIVFIDTPGIHEPLHQLGKVMVKTAVSAIADADVVLFVVDATQAPTVEDRLVAQGIRQCGQSLPVVMAFNKIDCLPSADSPYAQAYLGLVPVADWLPISATRGDNREQLLRLIIGHLPPGPRYYPSDQVTDQQMRFIAGELIREAAIVCLRQEVPYALAVVVDEFKERDAGMTYIGATLFVERDTQKGIVIGQGGKMLKQIGREARMEIQKMVGTRVFLELWVKVRPKWRRDEEELRQLGYGPSGSQGS
jgi:GTPase